MQVGSSAEDQIGNEPSILPAVLNCKLQITRLQIPRMSIKAKIEAIIYAAEEPITFNQVFALVKEEVRQDLSRKRDQGTGEHASPRENGIGSAPVTDIQGATPVSEQADAPGPESPLTETPTPMDVAPVEAEVTQEEPVTDVSGVLQASQDVQPAQENLIGDSELRSVVRAVIEELISDYSAPEHGIEVRQIAGGYRMATKPEQHDVVRAFAKSLKPPVRLSLQALETLAVIAYKQPVTAPEISEIRGVDSGGVLGTLLDRKLITTAGRKQVIGRPILYKTTKEFLMRFGLKDVGELPSMEEFEKLAAESLGADLLPLPPAEPAPEQAAVAETSANDGEEPKN
jgi:segregation and condensation protein B